MHPGAAEVKGYGGSEEEGCGEERGDQPPSSRSSPPLLFPGSLLSTLTHHSDYVTSLACSPNSNFVATAGLRGELFLVDMEVGGVAGRGVTFVYMEVGGQSGHSGAAR